MVIGGAIQRNASEQSFAGVSLDGAAITMD